MESVVCGKIHPFTRCQEAELNLSPFANIHIVLVNTTHAGNIGATARAMKTMGLSQLRLVAPAEFPSATATARAAGADDVLDQAEVYPTLDAAIAGCQLVVGSSARRRRIRWPELSPRSAASLMVEQAQTGPAALVFGRERMGLTNTELDRCQAVVTIPSNDAYPSLNLAAAVQLIAYELLLASQDGTVAGSLAVSEPPADQASLNGFYNHLRQVMEIIEFNEPERSQKLQRRLRRLFNRAQPTTKELNLLRGILTAIEKRQLGP